MILFSLSLGLYSWHAHTKKLTFSKKHPPNTDLATGLQGKYTGSREFNIKKKEANKQILRSFITLMLQLIICQEANLGNATFDNGLQVDTDNYLLLHDDVALQEDI